MSERILVIEDEDAINDLICMNLEVAGYESQPFFDGKEAWEALAADHSYSCAVVDVMLPGLDGFALLPHLREYGIPVIFLTAKGDVNSKVRGLTAGAEDYIVKPFEMLELLVRIDKVLARRRPADARIRIRDVEIFPEERKVLKNGCEVYLKPMEFDCLMMFVRNRNKALTRSQLLSALWGVAFDGETRTVDAHVGRIRKKLGFQDVIRTIPRVGYRMEADAGTQEGGQDR
ncbi:response regulator transcription factor [Parablautia sp. Marseille-Q6255]|uniref:response regulator transcription factor n=1 Tax=Parablautia sp. Marseille-Q6255 TaxID=3039593 RepID=UPI0024BC8769|nr:response regulator transcription factor [Parablautia sp. Marseille-Q6255]